MSLTKKRSRRAQRFLPAFYSPRPVVRAIQFQRDYGPYARRTYDAMDADGYQRTNRFTLQPSRRMMAFERRGERRFMYSWSSPGMLLKDAA